MKESEDEGGLSLPFAREELVTQPQPESSWADRSPTGKVSSAVGSHLWALADWTLCPG